MAISCPKCGAEIKKSFKFCLSCGYNLQTAASAGGISAESQAAKSETVSTSTQTQPTGSEVPAQPYQQPTSQQSYEQPPPYTPSSPKTLPIKIIGALIGIIVVVLVVVIVLMMLTGESGPLVGEWQTNTGGINIGMKINGDKSVEISAAGSPYMKFGNWEEKNGQLCLSVVLGYSGLDLPEGIQCYDYSISQDGRTMTWTALGQTALTWTKK